jgi:L-lysine 6-transaminase
LDLATPGLRNAVVAKGHLLGMMILATGVRGLRFRPAMNLTTEDLDLGVDLLRKAVAEVAATSPTLVG